jgi:hypothetical protein
VVGAVVGVGGRCGGGSGWSVRWWEWVVGAVCLWVESQRRFLRLRAGLRRIRWVAQFGSATRCALAAGGVRGQDRAPGRVTAHALGSAAGGSVWWVPEVKSRASGGHHSEGGRRVGLLGRGPRRFGFSRSIRCAGGCAALLGGGRCLWLRSVLGPSPHLRLTEADRSGGVKPHHTCCGPVSSGWTPPAR